MKKKLKIGKFYRIRYVGNFGFKHTYFGKLTDIEENKIVFDDNLYLHFKGILWIKEFDSKEDLFELKEVNNGM